MSELRNAVGKDLASARMLNKAMKNVDNEELFLMRLTKLQEHCYDWKVFYQKMKDGVYLVVIDVPLETVSDDVWAEETEYLREKFVYSF